MISRLINWFMDFVSDTDDDDLHHSGVRRAIHRAPAEPQPAERDAEESFAPEPSESLIRNKYLREDTGTHETLKILDDSLLDSGEEEGFDPYNTGDFDRSRNWERRFKS